jgi:XRE family aerobic/anaerobic benzoate catabolism transcriptional regulator
MARGFASFDYELYCMDMRKRRIRVNRSKRGTPSSRPSPDSDAYLRRLGERVRMMRNRRGMSRKALAKHAQLSERYLAQLETGDGNCSIVLLRRVARALGMPVEELVHDRPDPSVETMLLSQFLERLPPALLKEARELLLRRFGGAAPALKPNRIALIGLRGAGKSTIGELLAARLALPFIELDREIERLSGATLGELFEMFGQERFRRAEREAFERVLAQHQQFVLATGGSIVTEPSTFELLLSSCFTVWVRAEPLEHMQRVIDQGDLRVTGDSTRAMDDLVSILASREPLYARAEATIVTTGRSPQQNVDELLPLFGHGVDAPARAGRVR